MRGLWNILLFSFNRAFMLNSIHATQWRISCLQYNIESIAIPYLIFKRMLDEDEVIAIRCFVQPLFHEGGCVKSAPCWSYVRVQAVIVSFAWKMWMSKACYSMLWLQYISYILQFSGFRISTRYIRIFNKILHHHQEDNSILMLMITSDFLFF